MPPAYGRHSPSGFNTGRVFKSTVDTNADIVSEAPPSNDTRQEADSKAFVEKHLPLVYATALRCCYGRHDLACDICQTVFIDFHRQATRLPNREFTAGWLHRHTRFVASKLIRTEVRRADRERIATELQYASESIHWERMAPVLDDALLELQENQRTVLVGRFLQQWTYAELGQRLGCTEEAARKRVDRALDALRGPLERRGIRSTAAAIALAMEAAGSTQVPAGLGTAVSAAIGAQGVATGGVLATLLTPGVLLLLVGGLSILGVVRAFRTPPEKATDATAAALETTAGHRAEAETEVGPANAASRNQRRIPGGAAAEGDSPSPRQLYEEAQELRRAGKHSEAMVAMDAAVELLQAGIGRWEWYTEAYFTRATWRTEAKDPEGAIDDYSRLLEVEPHRYEALYNRALTYHIHLQQPWQAVSGFTQILEDPALDVSHHIGPKDKLLATTYEARGHAYGSLKNAAKAADDFSQALSLDPEGNGGVVYFYRAHAFKNSSRPDLAVGDSYQLAKRALDWAAASEAPYDSENRSLSCARWASEIFDHKVPYLLEVLAATEARANKHSEAIRTQTKALELLTLQDPRRPNAQQRLHLYKEGKSLAERADLLPKPAE